MITGPTRNPQRLYLFGLTATVLCVYLASLQAGYLAVDDGKALQLVESGRVSLLRLLSSGGREYYRPLATFSLVMDAFLYRGNLAGYHLTNVLLHLSNALLVYYLASMIFEKKRDPLFYAFLAGLLFAVHPVNAETVCWISARPDLLCGFFALTTLILAEKTREDGTSFLFTCLFLSFLCSLLAKEAAFFLPLLIGFRLFQKRKEKGTRGTLTIIMVIALAFFLYLLLREGVPLITGSKHLAATSSHHIAPAALVSKVAAVFGFYIRKLLWPFPLNFAIVEIQTTLCLIFFFLFIAAAVLAWIKAEALRFPVIFLSLSLIPPITAIFLFRLWTPYAERYLYQPSIAFALCATLLIQRIPFRGARSWILILIIPLAVATAFRVHLWTTPILFWRDTVEKSPRFGAARIVLAWEYLRAGHYKNAEETLKSASRLPLGKKGRESYERIKKELEIKSDSTITGRNNSSRGHRPHQWRK